MLAFLPFQTITAMLKSGLEHRGLSNVTHIGLAVIVSKVTAGETNLEKNYREINGPLFSARPSRRKQPCTLVSCECSAGKGGVG